MAKLEDMVNGFFSSHSGGMLPSGAFQTLERRIEGHTLQEMLAQLSSLGDHGSIPPGFQLAEDARTAAARAALADRVDKLKSARQTINELAGVPAKGSCASVVTVGSLDGTIREEGGDERSRTDHAYCFTWAGDVKESSAPVGQPNPLPTTSVSAASQAHTVEDDEIASWLAEEKVKSLSQLRLLKKYALDQLSAASRAHTVEDASYDDFWAVAKKGKSKKQLRCDNKYGIDQVSAVERAHAVEDDDFTAVKKGKSKKLQLRRDNKYALDRNLFESHWVTS